MKIVKVVLIIFTILLIYFLLRRYVFSTQLTSIADAKTLQVVPSSDLGGDTSSANFTYSIWFYVDDWNYKYGEPKVILGRMSSKEPQIGIILGAMTNDLKVSIDTYPSGAPETDDTPGNIHTCTVKNVPLQKWVHCLVSLYGKSLDVYIDGKLVRTCVLPGVAKVDNTTDVSITPMGGFSGFTSNFQYFSDATNPQQAYDLYKRGFGGGYLGNMFNKYKIKFVFLVDDKEQGNFEI